MILKWMWVAILNVYDLGLVWPRESLLLSCFLCILGHLSIYQRANTLVS